MLMPSLFRENLLDNFFDVPSFRGFHGGYDDAASIMRTDVKENDEGYEIAMNLPGFKKEDVQAELKDGYLTIRAAANSSNEEKDEKNKYIRRERYQGSCSRSFYLGDHITQEDIKARFEEGVLKIDFPKKEQKVVEDKKYITIEG